MVEVKFETTIGSESVEIEGSVVYGTIFHDERYNQYSQRTATGNLRVYDTGINVVSGLLIIKNVTYDDGEALRTWIREKAIYQLNSFTISSTDCGSPAQIDLGRGKGVSITNVTLTEKTDKGIFKYAAPGNYNVKFPFTYIR